MAGRTQGVRLWTRVAIFRVFLGTERGRARAVSSRVYAAAPTRRTRWLNFAGRGVWLGAVGSLLFYAWKKVRKNGGRGERKGEIVKEEIKNGVGGESERGKEIKNGGEGRWKGRFAGKVVLITGAAGDIGGATALAFAAEGATVVMVDLPHTRQLLEERCVQLEEEGAERALIFTADMTSEAEVKAMVEFTVQKAGAIHCFFNNAGIQGEMSPIHLQDVHLFRKTMDVNVCGVFLGLKYVATTMASSGGGVIVNTASLAGMLGPANMAAYAASKHAVIGLTRTATRDLARYGIRVCAISPGLLEGKMWRSQVEGRAKNLKRIETGDFQQEVSEEERQAMEQILLSGTPMGRLGLLSEVAAAVLFLCSEDASYLTGTVLPIDGGRLP